jgi:hypothetical protein
LERGHKFEGRAARRKRQAFFRHALGRIEDQGVAWGEDLDGFEELSFAFHPPIVAEARGQRLSNAGFFQKEIRPRPRPLIE